MKNEISILSLSEDGIYPMYFTNKLKIHETITNEKFGYKQRSIVLIWGDVPYNYKNLCKYWDEILWISCEDQSTIKIERLKKA
jgi:hypothetical protein